MQLSISLKLKKSFASEETLKKNYGKLFKRIILCTSILLGADTLQDVPNVPPTRRHKLSGFYQDCWGIDLGKNWRMVLRPLPPCEILNKIKNIEIVDIVDYH